MEHSLDLSTQRQSTRYGFHYFPDSLHYREEDLQARIPELKDLGASWLVMQSDANRAIPEDFILGLVKEKIEPIIHFHLNLANPIPANQIDPILSAYAKWGVHYVIFFDRPNSRNAWGDLAWAQANLVDKFIDQFLPLAQTAITYGLTPVFPPLEPGGQYWDTVFLRQALEGLQARNAEKVLARLGIAAYGWTWGKTLNWGAGGPEQWPQTKPYRIPSGSQDQRGFRIFDWYFSITKAVLQKTCPMILLQTGLSNDPDIKSEDTATDRLDDNIILNILKLLNDENVYDGTPEKEALQPIPEEVLCCNFWLPSSGKVNELADHPWISEEDNRTNLAQAILEWRKSTHGIESNTDIFIAKERSIENPFPISRYLLFPSLEWFLDNEQREEIQEYLIRFQPTIGFSIKEAVHAAIVDVAGDAEQVPDAMIEALRQSGCAVRRIIDSSESEINTYNGEELGDYPSDKSIDYATV